MAEKWFLRFSHDAGQIPAKMSLTDLREEWKEYRQSEPDNIDKAISTYKELINKDKRLSKTATAIIKDLKDALEQIKRQPNTTALLAWAGTAKVGEWTTCNRFYDEHDEKVTIVRIASKEATDISKYKGDKR